MSWLANVVQVLDDRTAEVFGNTPEKVAEKKKTVESSWDEKDGKGISEEQEVTAEYKPRFQKNHESRLPRKPSGLKATPIKPKSISPPRTYGTKSLETFIPPVETFPTAEETKDESVDSAEEEPNGAIAEQSNNSDISVPSSPSQDEEAVIFREEKLPEKAEEESLNENDDDAQLEVIQSVPEQSPEPPSSPVAPVQLDHVLAATEEVERLRVQVQTLSGSLAVAVQEREEALVSLATTEEEAASVERDLMDKIEEFAQLKSQVTLKDERLRAVEAQREQDENQLRQKDIALSEAHAQVDRLAEAFNASQESTDDRLSLETQLESLRSELADEQDSHTNTVSLFEDRFDKLESTNSSLAVQLAETQASLQVATADLTRTIDERDAARQQASELEMSTKDLRLKTMAALEGKEEQIAEALSNPQQQWAEEKTDILLRSVSLEQEVALLQDKLIKCETQCQNRVQEVEQVVATLEASNAVTVAAQAADSCALKDSQIALEQSNKRAEDVIQKLSNTEELFEAKIADLENELASRTAYTVDGTDLNTKIANLTNLLEAKDIENKHLSSEIGNLRRARMDHGDNFNIGQKRKIPIFTIDSENTFLVQLQHFGRIVDKIAISFGKTLYSFPKARIVILAYIVVLHLWMFYVINVLLPSAVLQDPQHRAEMDGYPTTQIPSVSQPPSS